MGASLPSMRRREFSSQVHSEMMPAIVPGPSNGHASSRTVQAQITVINKQGRCNRFTIYPYVGMAFMGLLVLTVLRSSVKQTSVRCARGPECNAMFMTAVAT